MNKVICGAFLLAILVACSDDGTSGDDLTGNESVYALAPGSEYDISGTVTFREKNDGATMIEVALTGTEAGLEHPVHLHLGNIGEADADVYALLNPVNGKSGISETMLDRVADETSITYQQLVALNACVKVHLAASGPDRDIVLAGGNIGAAALEAGRGTISVCKSE